MADLTNCPNCGAPVDLAEKCCPYCDTPYINHDPQADILARLAEVQHRMAAGVMTANEARALLGLPPR